MTNPESTSGRDTSQQPGTLRLRQILRNRYGVALLGLFVLLFINATIIHVLPPRYQADVLIDYRSGRHAAGALREGTTSDEREVGGSPICFPQTPFEILTSEKNIAQLSRDLDLPTRFQLPEGTAVVERVRGMIRIEPIGGTDLFCLIVTDTEEKRAIEITNGIYMAYEKVREKSLSEQYEQARMVLDKQIKDQEERVREAREKMDRAMAETPFIDVSPSTENFENQEDAILIGRARGILKAQLHLHKQLMEIETLRAQNKGLHGFEGDILVQRAFMLGMEDDTIKTFWPQLQELLRAEEEFERDGIAPNHPDRQVTHAQVASIRETLAIAAQNLRRALGVKLSTAEKQLVDQLLALNCDESDSRPAGMKFFPFQQALQEYDDQTDILKLLQEENQKQLLSFETPPRPKFLLWRAAASADRVHPYLPNKLLPPLLGALIGLSLGGGLVFLAAKRSTLKSTT